MSHCFCDIPACSIDSCDANEVIRAQTGGVVPGTGTGDIIPTFLEPGEIVVPRAFSETFEDRFSLTPDPGAGGGGGGSKQEFNFGTIIGTQEFVNDQLIPAIKEAREFDNADIGEF